MGEAGCAGVHVHTMLKKKAKQKRTATWYSVLLIAAGTLEWGLNMYHFEAYLSWRSLMNGTEILLALKVFGTNSVAQASQAGIMPVQQNKERTRKIFYLKPSHHLALGLQVSL